MGFIATQPRRDKSMQDSGARMSQARQRAAPATLKSCAPAAAPSTPSQDRQAASPSTPRPTDRPTDKQTDLSAPQLDGHTVVGARRLLRALKGSQVHVLGALHTSDPCFPLVVLVVLGHTPVLRRASARLGGGDKRGGKGERGVAARPELHHHCSPPVTTPHRATPRHAKQGRDGISRPCTRTAQIRLIRDADETPLHRWTGPPSPPATLRSRPTGTAAGAGGAVEWEPELSGTQMLSTQKGRSRDDSRLGGQARHH